MEESKESVSKLSILTTKERRELIIKLIEEQVLQQRNNLQFWRQLTNQPAQIDTGYIAQHLVSLVTKIRGGGFRGKGDDLEDGSEVKSANFLDSEDAKGAVSPRWNFGSNDEKQMLGYLELPSIYLVSIDWDTKDNIRFRIWKLLPQLHIDFNKRYKEWIDKLGYPKLKSESRPVLNFQLFPPKNKSDENYARHGGRASSPFEALKIYLEDVEGSELIFKATLTNKVVEIEKLME